MKLSSWQEIGSDGDVLLTPYVPKGITGYDDDDYEYRGADKFLARPGRKQATATERFDVHIAYLLS